MTAIVKIDENFKIALDRKNEIYSKMEICSLNLKKYSDKKGAMGLISDEVKKSKEYRNDKKDFDQSFLEVQIYNKLFLKKFKKEYIKSRRKWGYFAGTI